MKKAMTVTAMVLALTGLAGAQMKVQDAKSGVFTFQSCKYINEGLRCDLSYTGTKDTTKYFERRGASLVTPSGTTVGASGAAVGDGQWFTTDYQNNNVYAGIPVKFSLLFADAPKNLAQLAILRLDDGQVLRGVPVGAPVVAGSPTPAGIPVNVVKIDTTTFNAVMTNCKAQGAALYCNAVLTPKK